MSAVRIRLEPLFLPLTQRLQQTPGETTKVVNEPHKSYWNQADAVYVGGIMTLPGTVRLTHPLSDYPVFEIAHPTAHARIAMHGAHVLEWTPTGQKPVLYLSPQSSYEVGKAIRGGVPVCWPWFGAHASNPSLPSHGFVRNRFWQLDSASEDASGVTLKFSFSDDEETRALWPHAFHLTLECFIGNTLSLALTMENTGETEFTVTDALHTYFTVGDISQVSIEGLDGVDYLDTRGGQRQPHLQSGNIPFAGEVDSLYRTSSPTTIHDAAWQRVITVKPEGSQTTVVWNPWKEKAARLTDLPDESYHGFVCVETANAWQDVITVAPGAMHRLATHLSWESMKS